MIARGLVSSPCTTLGSLACDGRPMVRPSTACRDSEILKRTSSRDSGPLLNEEAGENHPLVSPWCGAYYIAQPSADVLLPRKVGVPVSLVDVYDSIG